MATLTPQQMARPRLGATADARLENPAYRDTLYVDELIGPGTVNTLPEATIAAFEDHGTVARTIDVEVEGAVDVMHRLGGLGIDMDDVGLTLEENGVAAFGESFAGVLSSLGLKSRNFCVDWQLATP